jgi:hypothetical protein
MILCSILILFFSWLLLHALFYSKSQNVIEGLTTTPSPSPPPPPSSSASPAENAAEIALLKTQIATLVSTASQLNKTMTQNEAGIKNNTDMIQKVVQSQNDTNNKLANMKKAQ